MKTPPWNLRACARACVLSERCSWSAEAGSLPSPVLCSWTSGTSWPGIRLQRRGFRWCWSSFYSQPSSLLYSTLTHTHTLSLLSNTHSHTLLPFYMRVAVWLPLEHCAGRSAAGERISFYSCLLRHGAHVECVNTLTQLHACQNVRVCVRARAAVFHRNSKLNLRERKSFNQGCQVFSKTCSSVCSYRKEEEKQER